MFLLVPTLEGVLVSLELAYHCSTLAFGLLLHQEFYMLYADCTIYGNLKDVFLTYAIHFLPTNSGQ